MPTNYDYELNSPEYEAARIAHGEAWGIYQHAVEAFREGQMEADEYLAARQQYTEAGWRFDEAERLEQERNENRPARVADEAPSLQGHLAI